MAAFCHMRSSFALWDLHSQHLQVDGSSRQIARKCRFVMDTINKSSYFGMDASSMNSGLKGVLGNLTVHFDNKLAALDSVFIRATSFLTFFSNCCTMFLNCR